MHNHAYIFFCVLFLFPPILVLSLGKMLLGWERQYCSSFPFCGIGRGMAGHSFPFAIYAWFVSAVLPCIMKWCDGSCADKQLSVGHPTTFKQGLIWITVIKLKLKIAWNKAIRNERNLLPVLSLWKKTILAALQWQQRAACYIGVRATQLDLIWMTAFLYVCSHADTGMNS